MKRNIKHISFSIAMLANLFYISSCRSADIDQDKVLNGSERSGGLAAVNINLLGSKYANSDKPAQVASINQKGLNVDNDIQHYSVLVSPSSFITAELTPNRSLNSVASSKNLNTIAAVTVDQLGAGNKFRVIVYKHDDGSYKTYQDYTIGQPVAPLMLDGGVNYDIVAYSYGVTTLPAISSGEQSNINSATINYDNLNRDLMYQKIGYTPNGSIPNNTLNIMLRHKIPNLTVVVTNNSGFDKISSVSNAKLGNDYPNSTFSLESGKMSDWGSSSMIDLPFIDTGSSTTSFKSSSIFVNNDTSVNDSNFSADIIINGQTKTINLSKAFKIIPEHKSTLTINSYIKCGAYLEPNNRGWKDFMCQNMGANLGIDPFSPEAGNHGAKYQWGAHTGERDRYISQADDQSHEILSGFNSKNANKDSWDSRVKGPDDPCPSGYKIPSIDQLKAVFENNQIERTGTWSSDFNNYSVAIYIKNNLNERTLMFPAAGYRDQTNNGTQNVSGERGYSGKYWSSDKIINQFDYVNGIMLRIDGGNVGGNIYTAEYYFSVRCIKE